VVKDTVQASESGRDTQFISSPKVQTGCGVYPAPCSVGTLS